jgi:hypothetical protein
MMYLIISYSKPVFWLSSYPKKPAVLLFHFAFLLAIHEGGTLKEMTLDGLLQLGLSDMKFIRCDVSVIHRHDIRIALHGESQLIECLGILI